MRYIANEIPPFTTIPYISTTVGIMLHDAVHVSMNVKAGIWNDIRKYYYQPVH